MHVGRPAADGERRADPGERDRRGPAEEERGADGQRKASWQMGDRRKERQTGAAGESDARLPSEKAAARPQHHSLRGGHGRSKVPVTAIKARQPRPDMKSSCFFEKEGMKEEEEKPPNRAFFV
ncbi:hypothetical protein EYF80_025608 [Liparis tanakae]|uniref:Uncharacterized protein n=1 Tax=Liparis tanakae TaxID=230148 RepID=A0A4Z2HEY3_9TELE|nr:hypothetical protein EYF80_025608 [Liparis tanakae]